MKQYNHKEIEGKIQKFWNKNKIPEKSLKFRKGKKKFYFIDGPPYASGSIHMGTALNKILKDYFVRYQRMKGFDVRYQPGYDTHGLPIANKVQKELGLKNKKEIEKFGIDKFNKECEKFATRHMDDMATQFNNLGVWMDWKNPYLTLHQDYMENAWATFKIIADKGYLYKGIYPVHVCGKCETVVSYNEIEYEKVTEDSILVKFKVKGKNEYLVIWTTTPWTLFANTGIMAHPNFDYAKVKVGDEVLIMANKLVKDVMKILKRDDYKVLEVLKGKKLKGMEYENPLKDMLPLQQKIKPRVVLSAQFVTLEQGTGLVHTAPGHGTEDFKVGNENGLDIICPVNIDGTYDKTAGKYEGMYVKDADIGIIEDLEGRGALLAKFPIKHDYPMCWRCKNPLLQLAVPQWFLKIVDVKEKLKKENKKIKWIPNWTQKRFHDWIENLGDWPITRQRYWGIPFPVWKCEKCDELKIIGNRKELGKKLKDIHMPYIDEVTFKCKKCKSTMKREREIFDVWFDSSVCSWASLGYPKDKKLFNKVWPPQINIEARDQIRGWWNSQLLTSYLAFGKKPYEAILMHGFVMDLLRKKLSKSAGAATPEGMVEKYGVDPLRFYLASITPGEDFFVDERKINEKIKIFNILWNLHIFSTTYCKNVKKPAKLNIEDKWIISKTNSLIEEVSKNNDEYYANQSIVLLEDFILNDFSRWYIKLIRERTKPTYKGKDRQAAFYTVKKVMDLLSKALAPVVPHISELVYEGKKSVHLTDWPKTDKKTIDKKLEKNMQTVMDLSEVLNSARQEAKIKLRWPVKRIIIETKSSDTKNAIKNLNEIIKRIGNVKDVEILKGKPNKKWVKKEFFNGILYLDKERTKELIDEALIKELVRKVQMKRKEAGFEVTKKINLYLKGEEELIKKWKNELEEGTTANIKSGLKGKNRGQLEFENKVIEFAF